MGELLIAKVIKLAYEYGGLLSRVLCCCASSSSKVAFGSRGELGGLRNGLLSLLGSLLLFVNLALALFKAVPTLSFGSQSMAVRLLLRSAMIAAMAFLPTVALQGGMVGAHVYIVCVCELEEDVITDVKT